VLFKELEGKKSDDGRAIGKVGPSSIYYEAAGISFKYRGYIP
jgi:hypothetical protein